MSNYIDDLENMLSRMPFGEVQLSLKKHNGNVTKLTLHTYESKRFDDNTTAAAHLLKLLQDATKSKQTGSISFTVMLKNGKIDTIIEQGYDSQTY